MKRYIWAFLAAFFALSVCAETKSFYDFTVQTIDGEPFDLARLKGKKVLIVNVASRCGFTPQYTQLQALYEQYGGDDFIILGFPANNFKEQEPGSNEEIKQFCTLSYGVTFPMMAKVSVKGEDIAPLYRWLTRKSENGHQDAPVEWNFQKFMIDENGEWAGVAAPRVDPLSEEIVSWIKK